MDSQPATVVGDPADDNVVGDGLPSQQIPSKSMLDGMGEDRIVAVFNPLPHGFRVQYARTLAQPLQMSREQQLSRMSAEERKAFDRSGLDIDKQSPGVGHSVQFLVLPAGETKNLPGDIAQVAVRKLITYILISRDKGSRHNSAADPAARAEVEQQIVVKVVDNMTLMNELNLTTQERTQEQIKDLNPAAESGTKTFDPPPGQGIHYEPNPASSKTTG